MKMPSWLSKGLNKIKYTFTSKPKTAASLDVLETLPDENGAWWGTLLIDHQQSRYSKIGNVILCIDNYNQEWKLDVYRENNLTQTKTKTLGSQLVSNEINLTPVLPDRTLHAKLECALFIPPGEVLNLYLATPIWIRIEVGSKWINIAEIPTQILADTWWGKNTLEGELCYAANLTPSLRKEDLPTDNLHVISLMSIQNQSRESISLKEVRLPLPFLSIFGDEQHQLWTEQVNVTFNNNEEANIVITSAPPQALINPSLLSESRVHVKSSFKNLFNYLRS